jgi:cytochrome c oxidase subunit 2
MSRGIQSALEPAGDYANRLGSLWDVFLIVSTVVYVLVIVFLIVALIHKKRGNPKSALMIVSTASAATVVILIVLLVASSLVSRGIAGVPKGGIKINVTARQWWWQIEYDHADVSQRITDANEINVPVGIPVRIFLRSTDVIHSFWVPNLHGKQDVVPGHDGGIVLRADRPGVYRGQCAEFCGLQHAKMAFWVNAIPPADYARWAEAARKPSHIPSTRAERQGLQVFLTSPCPLCHTIQGTDASGKTGPDLTHMASRRSFAAATLPNRRETLAKWILDPQHIKPGSQMPPMRIAQPDLDFLLTYLESLE